MSLFKTESQRITVWSVHQLSRVCLITYKQDTCRNENASFNWLIIVWEVLVRPRANWNGFLLIDIVNQMKLMNLKSHEWLNEAMNHIGENQN